MPERRPSAPIHPALAPLAHAGPLRLPLSRRRLDEGTLPQLSGAVRGALRASGRARDAESHFSLVVVSEVFSGMRLLARQRFVYDALYQYNDALEPVPNLARLLGNGLEMLAAYFLGALGQSIAHPAGTRRWLPGRSCRNGCGRTIGPRPATSGASCGNWDVRSRPGSVPAPNTCWPTGSAA